MVVVVVVVVAIPQWINRTAANRHRPEFLQPLTESATGHRAAELETISRFRPSSTEIFSIPARSHYWLRHGVSAPPTTAYTPLYSGDSARPVAPRPGRGHRSESSSHAARRQRRGPVKATTSLPGQTLMPAWSGSEGGDKLRDVKSAHWDPSMIPITASKAGRSGSSSASFRFDTKVCGATNPLSQRRKNMGPTAWWSSSRSASTRPSRKSAWREEAKIRNVTFPSSAADFGGARATARTPSAEPPCWWDKDKQGLPFQITLSRHNCRPRRSLRSSRGSWSRAS